ncbi:MAG: VLRF1 family aeRF1-type release factor [candidate division WOR-3 bacterium]
MISPETVKALAASNEQHCLTVYFNTGPSLNRAAFPARLKNLLRPLAQNVSNSDKAAFASVSERVIQFFTQLRPSSNSALIFATEKDWQEFFSRVPVRDQAWWGRPNINQLLWLLEEYRPFGVLIVDRDKVRFLAVRMQEFEEFKEFSPEIDTGAWRKQNLGSYGSGNAFQRGGADHRAFENRYMEQVRGFWRSIHKPIIDLFDRYHVRRAVVAGSRSILPEFVKALPTKLSDCVVAQLNFETFLGPNDAVKRIWPEIEAFERSREKALVDELLDAAGVSRKAAVGPQASLKFIQEGRAARLVVAKDFDLEAASCPQCQHVALVPGTCPKCNGSQMEKAALAVELPRLVAKHKVAVEVVHGEAASKIRDSGGMGVFLRY